MVFSDGNEQNIEYKTENSPIAAIIGGVVGAFAVVGAVIVAIVYIRRPPRAVIVAAGSRDRLPPVTTPTTAVQLSAIGVAVPSESKPAV